MIYFIIKTENLPAYQTLKWHANHPKHSKNKKKYVSITNTQLAVMKWCNSAACATHFSNSSTIFPIFGSRQLFYFYNRTKLIIVIFVGDLSTFLLM